MQNSKLTGIITRLNKFELNSLEKFLKSGWMNTDVAVAVLFEGITTEIFAGKVPKKEKIYQFATKKTKFDDKHFRYLTSALTQSIENFLAFKELFADEALLSYLKMKSMASHDMEKAYDYEHGNFLSLVKEKNEGNANFYLQRFLTLYQHLNYTYRKAKRKNIIRFDDVMLELDRFYIGKKLQLFAELFNAQNVLAAEYKTYLEKEITSLAVNPEFEKIPVISIYYHVLMTLKKPDAEEDFNTLRTLLKKNGDVLPVEELNDLYQYVRNYCIKKINLGAFKWSSILFEIYQEILANRKLMRHDYLSQWEYKNITTLGLRLGYHEWVEKFIRKFNYNLRPEERKNALVYNLANLHYHRKEYHLTLKMFQKVEFTDVYYQLDTKSILLKLYYEQGDEELLFFHAAAFKTFLSRNKLISNYHKIIYKNLVNFTSRLTRAGTSTKKLIKLKNQLNQTPQVADVQWIKQKLEELMPDS